MDLGTRKRLGLAVAVGLPMIIAIGVVALLVYQWVDGRRALSAAHDAAEKRPKAKILASTELPHGNAIGSYWGSMVPFRGGGLAIGNGSTKGDVLLELDEKGAPIAHENLPVSECAAVGVVAIETNAAIVLCGNKDKLEFLRVSGDESRLIVSAPSPSALPWASESMHTVIGSAFGLRHFWAVPKSETQWGLSSGEGLTDLKIVPLVDDSEISDLKALSNSEAVFVTVHETDGIKVSVTSSSGQIVRSALVFSGSSRDIRLANPKIFADASQVLVIWRQPQWRLFNLLAAEETILVARRFDRALMSLSETEALTKDTFVVPFEVAHTATGGIIAWDQGRRASWEVANFIQFTSPGTIDPRLVLRFPSGRLPHSIIQTNAGLLTLESQDEYLRRPFRTTLLER